MVAGLRDATPSDVEELKRKYPKGAHITHKLDGTKLPYNGCFYYKVTDKLRSWASVPK